MDFILLRIEPRHPGGNRPRLSLYLSSQLMYGVVRVYRKQIGYLFSDVHSLTSHFRLATCDGDLAIDLKLTGREKDLITMAEELYKIDISHPLYEADFGRSKTPNDENDLLNISDISCFVIGDDDIRSESQSSVYSDEPLPNTVPNHMITLKEVDIADKFQSLAIQDDFGVTNENHLQEMLKDMEQSQEELLATRSPSTRPDLFEQLGSPDIGDVRPHKAAANTQDVAEDPSKTDRPKKKHTKRKLPMLFTMDLSPIEVTPPRIKIQRRRRLIHTDVNIQISRDVIRENIKSTSDIVRPMKLVKLNEPTVFDLMTKGAHKGCNQKLFSRNTTKDCMGLKTYESDEGRPFWYTPSLSSSDSETSSDRGSKQADIPVHFDRREVSQEEVRAESSSLDATTQQSLVELQGTAEDTSSLRKTSGLSMLSHSDELHKSPTEDYVAPVFTAPPSVHSELAPVVEEMELDDPSIPIVIPITDDVELLSQVQDLTADTTWTTFAKTCPPDRTSKKRLAGMFSTLLNQCAKGRVVLRQKRAFGNIHIARGSQWP